MKIKQRNTAVQSYYQIIDLLPDKRRQVFEAIKILKVACNVDISRHLGIPINRVTPRTNELVKLEVVEESHRAIYPETGKRVIYWRAKEGLILDQMPLL